MLERANKQQPLRARAGRHVVYDSKASETNDPECAGPMPPCPRRLPPACRQGGVGAGSSPHPSAARSHNRRRRRTVRAGPLSSAMAWVPRRSAARHGSWSPSARVARHPIRHSMPARGAAGAFATTGGQARRVATQRNVSAPGCSYCDDAWPCHYFPAVFSPHFKVRPPARQSTPSTFHF